MTNLPGPYHRPGIPHKVNHLSTLQVISVLLESNINLNVGLLYPGFDLIVSHSNCLDDSHIIRPARLDPFLLCLSLFIRSSTFKQICKMMSDQVRSNDVISSHYIFDVSSIDIECKERFVDISNPVSRRHERAEEGGAGPLINN